MTVRILQGDCRDVLRTLPDESVHCVVTSPPYWGLRDYGVDGQIGLEREFSAYIETMVELFRDVRRALRSNGTLWLNLGDSYAGSGRGGNPTRESSTLQGSKDGQEASMVRRSRGATEIGSSAREAAVTNVGRRATRGSQLSPGLHANAFDAGAIGRAWVPPPFGVKQKDLMGMPWRVAFALQADGWWLRQDIIWSKPNPMPESVTDRCTKAHEYLFLLSKSETYYFDQEAILEECSQSTHARLSQDVKNQIGSERAHAGGKTNGNMKAVARRGGGNRSHKGTTAYDNGAGEHRTKAGLVEFSERQRKLAAAGSGIKNNESMDAALAIMPAQRNKRSVWTVATQPFSEAHFATFPPALIEPCILAGCPKGGTVLDPFGGAGTTGLVADRLGRDVILIELNPDYVAMAERRLRKDAGMFAQVTA